MRERAFKTKRLKSASFLLLLLFRPFGSRLMERNPLHAVATMKVRKEIQMRGMRSMFDTVTFFRMRRPGATLGSGFTEEGEGENK